MSKSKIVITAGLQINGTDGSVAQIKQDLKKITEKLNREKAFRVQCSIDTSSDSISAMQAQLDKVSKKLSLNISNINIGKLDIRSIQEAIDSQAKDMTVQAKVETTVDSGSVNKASQQIAKEIENATQTNIKLNEKRTQNRQYAYVFTEGSTDNILQSAKDTLNAQFKEWGTGDVATRVKRATEDSTQELQRFTVQVEKQNGATETLIYQLDEVSKRYEYLGKTIREADNSTAFRKTGVDVQKEIQAENINKIVSQIKTANIYTGEFREKVSALREELSKVNDTNTMNQFLDNFSIFKAEVDSAKAESQYISKLIREEESLYKIELSRKQLQDEQQHRYWQGQFEDSIKSMTAENQVLKEMKKYYEELDKAAKNFENTRKSVSSKLNTSISRLNSQSRSTAYRNNSGSPEVEAQLFQIEELRSKYRALQTELQTATTPESLVEIQQELDKLTPEFNEVINASKNLQATLRNDSFAKSLDNKIQKLSADMNNFAVANQKAISSTKQMSDGTTFADKWIQLSKQMARGTELNADELRHLQEEFRIFGKEAETAGLKGQSVWSKFLSSFKTVSTYITANMVFNWAKRQLQGMAQEVIAVDTAMVELRKVTEATDAEFEDFLLSAAQTGRELGASISDVVNATSTFSRAGFNLPDAEELGRIATLYKNVGDGITIDSASESIVSVMKAFNIEANDSISIIDKINKVSNEYAIDSGGLGESLQRVSSAMASANNTLDETIALTTVANEIVQDPLSVAQGWRTVALRIRGAKTELEEANLDTDGMVESTAKLRDLVKGISGVDIMADESTFKSTYEIIKEIGTVWNDISDVNQASLLEALAGKRQSNIVAAALSNYERLGEVLDTSMNSMGSATREQEEYAKSIQYSIETFKSAFQGLSQTVMGSDLIKGTVDFGTGFIDILDTIIDKAGAFPALLTGLATVGGIKGVGVFGDTISSLDDIMDRLKGIVDGVSAFKSQFSTLSILKDFDINLKGLSDVDISSLQEYISLLDSDEVDSDALAKSLESASSAAKTQAMNLGMLNTAYKAGEVSEKAYTAATQNLATTQKVATATSKALAIGLNLIGNLVVAFAITALVKGIDNLVHAEEKAKEKATELRKEAVEQLNAYAEETKTLKDSIKQYQEIISTTSDLATEKSKLVDIQENINSGIEQEKDKVDLLNKSLSENIELVQKQQLADAKQTVLENQAAYDTAKEAMSYRSTPSDIFGADARMKGVTSFQFKMTRSDKAAFLDGITTDSFVDNFQYGKLTNAYVYLTGTLEEQRDTLVEMMNIYKEQDDYDKEKYQILVDQKKELDAQIKDYGDIVRTYEQAQDTVSSLEIPDDVRTAFNEVLENYVTAQQELKNIEANEGSNIEIQKAQKNVQDLGNELMATAGKYVGLRDIAIQQTNAIQTGTAEVITSLEALSQDVKDNLDGSFKDTLSNVDKIKAAMQTLASGEGLDWSTVQELLFDIDTDKVLDTFKEVNGKYEFVTGNYKSLISLKDQIIKQQLEIVRGEKAEQEAALNTAQANLSVAQAKLARSQSESDALYYKGQIADIESEIKTINGLISNSDTLIMYLNSQLGDTVSIEKAIETQQKAIEKQQKALQTQQKALNNELKKAQENADNYAKAMTAKLDNIIDGLEKEKDTLSDEKELLEEQLDSLEEKKSEIEEIISQYKELVDVVKSETDRETELLKEQQKAEEDAIQARIDALKEAREQKEEETSLTEKELELQQKLADLEKARNTKVRTYSSERGWHYDVDKEAVANAQTAVDEAQQSYDKAIDDKLYNDQLSALEAEKKAVSDNYEAQIQAYQDYYEQWKAILEEQENAEKEQLAEQIFGVEWREKIKNRDTTILNKFKSNFKSYNTQLNSLINGEIASLQKSIKAKEEEIKAKEAQIESWKNYQQQVNETIERIKGKYDEYLDYLDEIKLDENSNLTERQEALANFAANYSGMIDEMNEKQLSLDAVTSEIDGLAEKLAELQEAGSASIDISSNISDISEEMANFIESYREGVEAMRESLEESLTGYGVVNSEWDAKLAKAANALRGYSYGGVIDYTGGAMVHGKPSSSEVAFNSGQAKSLYDMVRSGDFSAMVAERAYQGFAAATHQLNYNGNTDNSNRIININGMVIKADNPAQFHDQFMREIGNYWQIKLTESRVKAPL